MRQDISLNFDWLYKPDFQESYLHEEIPGEGFIPAMIPHTNKVLPFNNFDEKEYQFVSSYQRVFSVPETAKAHRLILRFGGVMTVADVYVNGTHVCTHEGGFTPFAVDITDVVALGGDNRLFVKVDSREIKDIPPFGNVIDFLCYGGIYREVTLQIRPEVYISQAFLETDESPNLQDEEMVFNARLFLNKPAENEYDLDLEIFKDGKPFFADRFTGTFTQEIDYSMRIEKVERWDLDHPNLYDFRIALSRKEEVLDVYQTRFGFRTAQFTVEGFVLNNRKIKLIGLDRHQSYPYVGFAMPKRVQQKDADILKRGVGCNMVRTSHYMQSDHFIDRCDEIGLLVFEEIPGWQYIGNDHFKELSKQNLKDMIVTHVNHPSIVLWGVRVNESSDDDDFYAATNALAHAMDPSRQTGGVRNFAKSHLFEDVYTYNDFSHIGGNPGLVPPRSITGGRVPYLITEHNGHIFPTKKFDSEQKRLEQALRHLKVVDAVYGQDDSCGAIGWCLNDYNTHVEFGAGDRICYHGVMDMFRIPKYAAAVYASQQKSTPVLVVASNLTMGEYSQAQIPPTVIFTNCDYLKVYKNGVFVGQFYSDWENYPDIPNAPVIVDDYIGDQIEQNEPYKKTVARRIKKVLISFQKHGMNLPFLDKLRALNLMTVHRISMTEAMSLYGKYVGDWGKEGASYVFEGYQNDALVKTVQKGASRKAILSAVVDDEVLFPEATYDATRIVVRMMDESGNDRFCASDVLELSVSPELEILGPTKIALVGGSTGFYVRTTGLKGQGLITIACAGQPDQVLKITIE